MMDFSNHQYSLIYPARIVEYFPADQTATVLISAERIYNTATETNISVDREPIKGVPVHIPSGGGWSLTFPIKPGDTCLVVFSQVGYDHWLYADEDTAGTSFGLPKPHLQRRFKEDDGFCLVGFNTLPRAITDHHATGTELRGPVAADQHILLADDDSITITSSVSLTINAPDVTVNCTTAEVNASANVDMNTPIVNISDNCTIGGTLQVTGAVTNLSTVVTTGSSTSANIITGAAAVAGLMASGSMTVAGLDMSSHVHAENGTGGGITDGPTAP